MHRRIRAHGQKEAVTHTIAHMHAPPLKANAIEGRITAKSIRTNLREMKWSKSKMKRGDGIEWKRGGRLGFTRAQGLLLSTLWTIRTTATTMTASQSRTNKVRERKTGRRRRGGKDDDDERKKKRMKRGEEWRWEITPQATQVSLWALFFGFCMERVWKQEKK